MTSPMPRPSRSDQVGDADFDPHRRLLDICRGLSVGPAIAASFIDDYLQMLGERIARIDRDLSADDRDEAIVALLSLDSSSTMLGAYDVSETAQRLRSDLEQGTTPPSEADLAELHIKADRARTELTAVREHVQQHH